MFFLPGGCPALAAGEEQNEGVIWYVEVGEAWETKKPPAIEPGALEKKETYSDKRALIRVPSNLFHCRIEPDQVTY